MYATSKKRGDVMSVDNFEDLMKNREWKEKNKKYLRELQKFFDKADNITDDSLKQKIIGQMLRCDDILTKAAEEEFMYFYKIGYNNAKEE